MAADGYGDLPTLWQAGFGCRFFLQALDRATPLFRPEGRLLTRLYN
jgi:hypothetical protein